MYPTSNQFESIPGLRESARPKLNKYVRKNYPELLEQLSIQLRQKRLAEKTCFPWELDCKQSPANVSGKG